MTLYQEKCSLDLDDMPLVRQAALAGLTTWQLAAEMRLPVESVREFLQGDGIVYLDRFEENDLAERESSLR